MPRIQESMQPDREVAKKLTKNPQNVLFFFLIISWDVEGEGGKGTQEEVGWKFGVSLLI